jgi:hypothetical protein
VQYPQKEVWILKGADPEDSNTDSSEEKLVMNKLNRSTDYVVGREHICRFTYDVKSLGPVIYVTIYGVSHET